MRNLLVSDRNFLASPNILQGPYLIDIGEVRVFSGLDAPRAWTLLTMAELADCHCHLSVSATLLGVSEINRRIENATLHSLSLHVMSTNHWDMAILAEIVKNDIAHSVIPYLGLHPWYSHLYKVEKLLSKRDHYFSCLSPSPSEELLEVLPDPTDLDEHLEEIRQLALAYEKAGRKYGIGEIGLDKLFRVPLNGFYGNQKVVENVLLTQCKVTMEHQKMVFTKQLELANLLKKLVSLHCVKAHGPFFDITTGGFHNIACVVLHSYTGSLDQAKAWAKIFKQQKRKLCFSFSDYINASEQKLELLRSLLCVLEPHQILTESDMPIDKYLRQENTQNYFAQLAHVTEVIAQTHNWDLPKAQSQLYFNSLQLH